MDSDISQVEEDIMSIESRVNDLEDMGYTDIHILSGYLYSYDRDTLNTSVYYWKKYIYISDIADYDSMLVQVWTRKNTGYLWSEPTWYLYESGDVRIIDDENVDHGYEYKILAGYKKG